MAAWTGEEVLIYGGTAGVTDNPSLVTGHALHVETGVWRDLPPSPVNLDWWPHLQSVWTGEVLMVVGRTPPKEKGEDEVFVLSYSPDLDEWTVSPRLPANRGVGAVVWTGSELILTGGELVREDNTAWGYDPDRQSWRRLPDPGIPPVEAMEGVWTGSEAIFVGGYSLRQPSPAVAYDPATDSWRHLSPIPWRPTNHRLVWTGTHVVVYSGHTGPEHRRTLLLYDLDRDTWTVSTPMPITPRERLAGDWTGSQLIIWGGSATYGEADDPDQSIFNDGATYDPENDSWRIISPSPLTPRCDHTGTWTGEVFIVVGGLTDCDARNVLADSGVASYQPDTDQWRELRGRRSPSRAKSSDQSQT